MSTSELKGLEGQKRFLTDQIGRMPPGASLTRRSLESRLRTVEAALARTPANARDPAKVSVTFRGRPVFGVHGVVAQFGTDAARAFTDAVAAVSAALQSPLRTTGPIPERNRLLITGTALGSFGFEFEEILTGEAQDGGSIVATALEKTQALIASSVEGSDDELAETVGTLDPRALGKIRDFVKVLAENDATCAIEREGRRFSFQDGLAVDRSLDRLNADNVRETPLDITGVFVGVMPVHRTFEFRQDGQQDVIWGRISTLIDQPGLLTGHWGNRFAVRLIRTQVGNGNPTYTLLRADRLPDDGRSPTAGPLI
jgi:hypothetical protein